MIVHQRVPVLIRHRRPSQTQWGQSVLSLHFTSAHNTEARLRLPAFAVSPDGKAGQYVRWHFDRAMLKCSLVTVDVTYGLGDVRAVTPSGAHAWYVQLRRGPFTLDVQTDPCYLIGFLSDVDRVCPYDPDLIVVPDSPAELTGGRA
jgi:hypothetical protein